MDEELRKQIEYEEQFFGMSSQFFSDCFKNLILDEIDGKVTMLVENLRRKLINQASNPVHFEKALKKMEEDLNTEYRNVVKKLFPEIEAKVRSFMHIPLTVLLKEDSPVRKGLNGNLNVIQQENENLKGTLSSLLYLKHKIVKELEEADSAIFCMECTINRDKLAFSLLPINDICALSKANIYLVNNESY